MDDDDAQSSPIMTESPKTKTPETVIIASDGNAILVIGPEQIRLRVSTVTLGLASKVFKAMFSANWLEGQNLSSACPKEIQFPEDEPAAMEAICCVLHFRNDITPESLTPKQVLHTAIACDKYDLSVALRLATTTWLNPPTDRKRQHWEGHSTNEFKMIDEGYLLAAAYILQDTQSFARISHDIISHYTVPYSVLYENEAIRDALPPMTFYCLEERRTQMRTEILRIWDDGIKAACSGHKRKPRQDARSSPWENENCEPEVVLCDWGRERGEKYKALRERYQTDMNSTSVAQLAWESERSRTEDWEDLGARNSHRADFNPAAITCTWEFFPCNACCRDHVWRSHSMIEEYDDTFRGQWETVKRRCCLCFDCLEGNTRSECSFGHELLRLGIGPFTPASHEPVDDGDDGW
ncbi:hypothetical protein V8F20_010314 [Naviculisporaceae sp. PSN 640]